MTKAVIEITGDASGLASAVQQANQQIGTLSQQVQKASEDMKEGFGRLRSVGLQVMAALGLADLAKQSLDASIKLEKMSTTLRFASGSADEAAKNNEFLRRTVKELGLDLATAGDAFAKLAAAARGTKLEGEGARSVFDAVAKASTAMGLNAEQTQGALLAVQQMMSKGTVQAEELRGQLGERLPGAFQIAARSLGVTTEELGKLLEKGMVPAAEFLPRFAAQLRVELGDAALKAADSLQAAMNRMQSAKLEALKAMQNADLTKAMFGGFTEFLETLPQVLQKSTLDIQFWARGIAATMAVLADTITMPLRLFNAGQEMIGQTVAKWYFWEERMAAQKRGDAAGAERARQMGESVQMPDRQFSPTVNTLYANRAFAANEMGPGRAEFSVQQASNQRAADLALLATKAKLGAGDDKEAAKAAEELRKRLQKSEEDYLEGLVKNADEEFWLQGQRNRARLKEIKDAEELAAALTGKLNPAYAEHVKVLEELVTAVQRGGMSQEDANDALERAGMAAMAATDPFAKFREQLKETAAGFNEILTPAEEYARKIERIELLVRENQISEEQADRQRRKAWADFSASLKDSNQTLEKGVDIAKDLGATFSSAFEDAVTRGKGVRAVLQGIVQDLARMAIRQAVTNPAASMVQMGINALGTLAYNAFSPTGASAAQQAAVADWTFYGDQAYAAGVSGARAVGGYVEAGSLYRVNDGGMGQFEAFRPRVSGEIVSLGAGGDQGPVVHQTINISTGVAQTVRAEVMRLLPAIQNATQAGWADRRARGGSYARA